MKFEVSSNKIFSFIGSNKEEIHPFWLRERVSEKEYLDEGTQQRLFDPSSMKQTVEIVNAEINGEFFRTGSIRPFYFEFYRCFYNPFQF